MNDDLLDSDNDGLDSLDRPTAKRRRVSRACDHCRKKKVKCDGVRPTCTNCKNSAAHCVYTDVERKPSGARKRTSYVGKLESRLDRIESMLEKLVGSRGTVKREVEDDDDLDEDEDEDESDLGSVDESFKRDDTPPADWQPLDVDVPAGAYVIKLAPKLRITRESDMFARSLARGNGELYTSGNIFLLFSKKGMNWISDTLDDHTIAERISAPFAKMHILQQERIRLFVEPMSKPYPLDLRILKICVEAFTWGPNAWRLIITQDEIEAIVEAEFYDHSLTPNGWSELCLMYGIVGLVLPVAFLRDDVRSRLDMTIDTMNEVQNQCLATAMYYSRRVSLMVPTMTTVRALTVLLLAFQCSSTPHPVLHISRVTTTLAIEMGLNRKEGCAGLGREEANRRKCLWWIIYVFSHDVALKVGRCPDIVDFDVTTEPPDFEDTDIRQSDFKFVMNMADFFRISSKCFEKLFSASASKKTPAALVRDVHACDEELMKWKDSLPDFSRPGSDLNALADSQLAMRGPDSVRDFHRFAGVLYLHLVYYQLLSSIHRLVAYHPSWVYSLIDEESAAQGKGHTGSKPSSGSGSSPNNAPDGTPNSSLTRTNAAIFAIHRRYPRLFTSLETCNQAARMSIELVRMTQRWGKLYLWGSLYFATSSVVTLFIKCIAKPLDPSTPKDLELLRNMTDVFSKSEACEFEELIPLIRDFWLTLHSVALTFVEKAQANSTQSPSSTGSTSGTTPISEHLVRKLNRRIKRTVSGVKAGWPGETPPRSENGRNDQDGSGVAGMAVPDSSASMPPPTDTYQYPGQFQPPASNHPLAGQHNSAGLDMGVDPQGGPFAPMPDSLDYLLPDQDMVHSLFQMSSVPFSWESDLGVFGSMTQ